MTSIPDEATGAAPGVAAKKAAKASPPADRIPNWRLFTFAAAGLPVAMTLLPQAAYLAPYMTGELGVSPSAWALVILVGRFWDALIDPISGVVSDRFPSRWGRRRHWVALGVPIYMLGIALLFMPHLFMAHITIFYVLLALCVTQAAQALYGLNMQAWGAELTEDYNERTRVMGWRTLVAGFAAPLSLGIGAAVEQLSKHPTNGAKLFYIAVPVLILLPLLNILALVFVPEKPARVRPRAKHERMGLLKSWSLLLRNKNMLRLLVIDMFVTMPFSISAAINFFYVAYVLQAPRLQSLLLISSIAVGFLSMPAWLWVSRYVEKHKLIAFASAAAAVVSCSLVFFGPGDVIPFAIAAAILGLVSSAPIFLLQSVVADVVDSDTLATGEERTGTFYALMQLTAKFAPALGIMVAYPFLQWVGFDFTGKHNTPESINWLKYTFAIFPPIPLAITAWLAYTFPLGKKEQEDLRRKIREQHG